MKELMTEKKLREIIFMNLGAASMCWSEYPKGVFNSTRAEQLGNEIVEAVKDYIDVAFTTTYFERFERSLNEIEIKEQILNQNK
jgi:hypothetical protein